VCIYAGETEGMADKLRSILAQFEFKYRIELYEGNGVPFSTYLYVPEKHPETGATFFEREDEAHLIKVQKMKVFFTVSDIIIDCFIVAAYSKSYQKWRPSKHQIGEIY